MFSRKNHFRVNSISWKKTLTFFIFNVLQRSSSSTTASQGSGEGGSSSKAAQPQTLEELLERQWEQGSQFLMEQASHFDSKLISHEFFPFYRKYNSVSAQFFRQITQNFNLRNNHFCQISRSFF